MRTTLFLALALLAPAAFADDIQHLPEYAVTADVIAAMIPCDQVRDLCDDAAVYRDTFDLSVVTVIKAPTSRFAKPVRCFIRGRDGRVLKDITSETLLYPVDPHWPAGYLSSNQPAEYAVFYFMLKPRLDAGPVTLDEAEKLLNDYTHFAERRLDRAVRYYGAHGSWSINLRWSTVPDEIVFVGRSPAVAEEIGRKLEIPPNGRTVSVTIERLAALKARLGHGFAVTNPADLECVTPWSSLTGLPPIKDRAALFRLGWVDFRREPSDPGRRDFIAIAMQPAPEAVR